MLRHCFVGIGSRAQLQEPRVVLHDVRNRCCQYDIKAIIVGGFNHFRSCWVVGERVFVFESYPGPHVTEYSWHDFWKSSKAKICVLLLEAAAGAYMCVWCTGGGWD